MSKPDDKPESGSIQFADHAVDDPQPESLDKVRDILFGSQMRSVESRLQGMEERMRQEQDSMRADFKRQVESLDALIRSEVQGLIERLSAERTRRTEELNALAAELKDTIRALERRHVKLEEDANQADAALRDALSRSHQELNFTKTDSTMLAALLNDLATRLGGVPESAAGTGKNGPRS